jgi:hypothetical protein
VIFKQGGFRCKTGFSDLQNVAASYNGSHKILQRQTFSCDFPFNSGKSKQLNLESKALEDI